jgi:hypothetical protein
MDSEFTWLLVDGAHLEVCQDGRNIEVRIYRPYSTYITMKFSEELFADILDCFIEFREQVLLKDT